MNGPWYGICPEHGVARMEPNKCRFCDAPRVAIVEPERYDAMQAVVEAVRAAGPFPRMFDGMCGQRCWGCDQWDGKHADDCPDMALANALAQLDGMQP